MLTLQLNIFTLKIRDPKKDNKFKNMYKIPLFNLSFDKREKDAISRTLDSKWISTGPECNKFEKLFSEKLNTDFSLTTSSCTASLHMALIALGINDGDEVLVPSLTFSATANVIKYVGAKPIFCDIKSLQDLTIDPKEIENKITNKTKAIIVMHYAGFSSDMDNIVSLAKKNKLFIIEDAAHAPMSEYKGKKLGTIGDVGTFSFFSNKNIAIGEGGMVVTNNKEIYDNLKLLRSHGMTSLSYERFKGHANRYDIQSLGYNYRMDDIRASIGIVQLNKLEKDLSKRSELRKYYIKKLSKQDKIIIPFKTNNSYVSNYIFPIILNNNQLKRDEIRDKLGEKGIQTSVHYPAVHRFSIYENDYVELSKTDFVTDNEITLPMYYSLGFKDIDYITNSLNEIIG